MCFTMQNKIGQKVLFGRQNAVYWLKAPIMGTILYTSFHLPYPYSHFPNSGFIVNILST